MIATEYEKILKKNLPKKWQGDIELKRFEDFLQANWDQRKSFYQDYIITKQQQFIDFDYANAIKTQNYIGTIFFEGEELNVFPKVYKNDEDDDQEWDIKNLIYNLTTWLEYCDRLNFPFVNISSQLTEINNMLELFITVYVHYVFDVLSREIYRNYEEITEVGSVIKGKIDFKDYVLKKVSTGNRGKVNYTYSEFLFDNKLNRIIKYTCKNLLRITSSKSNEDILKKILIRLNDVSDVSCTPYNCDEIHLNKLNRRYNIILDISKMFLLNKINSYEMGSNHSFCFLFPSELLFEGFVSGFMKEHLKDVAEVSTQVSDQYLTELFINDESHGEVFKLIEDIIIENEKGIFILDTKYKIIDKLSKASTNRKLGISDEDMKQMVTYAIKKKASKLYLIYPLVRNEEPEDIEVVYQVKPALDGILSFPVEIIKVPFIFRENDDQTVNVLRQEIEKIIR